MNTGHDGSLSTGHANSSRDMLLRLETMVLMGSMQLPIAAIRRQIASAIDILVHLGRVRDGTRKVLEISEILGMDQEEIAMKPLFVFSGNGRKRSGCTWYLEERRRPSVPGKNWKKKDLSVKVLKQKTDRRYRMEQWKRRTKERSRRYVSEAYVQTLAAAAGISMITAFLFYRSVWGMCTFFVFAPLCLKFRQKREAARREVQIQKEFLTAMESVSGALMAGYSLESAWEICPAGNGADVWDTGYFQRGITTAESETFHA